MTVQPQSLSTCAQLVGLSKLPYVRPSLAHQALVESTWCCHGALCTFSGTVGRDMAPTHFVFGSCLSKDQASAPYAVPGHLVLVWCGCVLAFKPECQPKFAWYTQGAINNHHLLAYRYRQHPKCSRGIQRVTLPQSYFLWPAHDTPTHIKRAGTPGILLTRLGGPVDSHWCSYQLVPTVS